MISYAQNHEDVLLDRCFRDQATGFYIDVGAWEPVLHSVTHHFYLRGWRGINVEPVPQYFAMLVAARMRDINLQLALSDRPGESTFSVIEGSGLSTLRSLDDDHVRDLSVGGFPTVEVKVTTATLADVCRHHVPPGQVIDFLKVDVEGWEAQVLRGGDWTSYRPRIVIVEVGTPIAFDPVARRVEVDDTSSEWEPALLAEGYHFALADGLNRWFVRAEDGDLLRHFRLPVNVLDDYLPLSLAAAQEQVRELHHRAGALHQEVAQLQVLVDQLEHRCDAADETLVEALERGAVLEARLRDADARIDALESSTSWRMTAPIRSASDLWRRHRGKRGRPVAAGHSPLRVALYAGIVVDFDAVSTSLLHKLHVLDRLREMGYSIQSTVFTQGTDFDRPEFVIVSPDELTRHADFLGADLHVFEFGMHYELFDAHLALPKGARSLVVDHSTTPPALVDSPEARSRCADAIARRDQLAWSDLVACVGELTRDHHLDHGFPPERLSVLHLPPACSRGPAVIESQTLTSRPGPVHFVFVGRFVRAKGIYDLLPVVEHLVSRSPGEMRFTLIGDTRFSDEAAVKSIERLLDRHGHEGSVRLLSRITADELEQLYRAAHALVLPSYHEGYCVPVVEALWSGCFPITYDAGNLPNVTGGLGAIVPTGDVEELEHALEEFAARIQGARSDGGDLTLGTARHGELLEPAWRAALRAHLRDYSSSAYTERFLGLLTRLLEERPGTADWLRNDTGELARQVWPLGAHSG